MTETKKPKFQKEPLGVKEGLNVLLQETDLPITVGYVLALVISVGVSWAVTVMVWCSMLKCDSLNKMSAQLTRELVVAGARCWNSIAHLVIPIGIFLVALLLQYIFINLGRRKGLATLAEQQKAKEAAETTTTAKPKKQ